VTTLSFLVHAKTLLSYCRLWYTYKSATHVSIACWCRYDSQFMQHCILMPVGTLH